MCIYYSFLLFILLVRSLITSHIEIDVPSISPSYIFELSSNASHSLQREVLVGFVDGTSSSIPSSILVQASYKHLHVEHLFNLYQSNTKIHRQSLQKEPIFRSYLLTPSCNRSYPFIRVLIGSVHGSYENLTIQPVCAIVTAVSEQNHYETQTCFLSPQVGYCLTTIPVLKMLEYMNKNDTKTKIEVYYKLYHVLSINECALENTPKQNHIHHETRIGHVEYVDNDISFSTMTRSSVSIDYPNGIHYPDWYFPLKLKLIISSSFVSLFTIRCRLLSYFSIHSIQTNIPKISNYLIQINHNVDYRQSITDIDFHIKMNQLNKTNQNYIFEIDLATVTLRINSTDFYKNTHIDSKSIVFIDWFLLLNSSLESDEPILRIPIQIQYDDIQTIASLTDFTSLINTAILSMQVQQYSLTVLAINYSGSIQSISRAVCHSENVYLIQVDPNCKYIYFSGQERDDFFDHVNNPTAIVVRYEKYLQRLFFTIYIPERPLRIEISDSKLSRINGWFVTKRPNHREQKDHAWANDFDNGKDDTNASDGDDDDDDDIKCYPVYQQASIHVFTRFYRTTQNGDRIYLFNKLNVLITPLVRAYLETDNANVAFIKDDRVIGVGQGKTNIRIYSFTNKLPMGSKTIYVDDHESVHINNISFNFLTNIDFQTSLIEHIDPIYKIHFHIKPIFNRFNIHQKNQFGLINVILTYSDNTSTSLDDIPSEYYQFNIDTNRINPSMINIDSVQSWKTFYIRALTLGRTHIHSRLKLGQQQCTDDKNFSQNDLICEIMISSISNMDLYNNTFNSPSLPQTDHYIVFNHTMDQRSKISPFLIVLSILLGTCIVLSLVFGLHWFINGYYRKKCNKHERRQRNSTQSGAEEVNHDWIFLDRNSLEMPTKQTQQPQQSSSSINNSTLHLTPNPITSTSILQQPKELSDLTHSQMIAYFENLKESHA